jgi:hypothetical protein
MRTMFNKAIRDGKLEKNPTRGVKFLRENNERDRVLSPDEWELIRVLAMVCSYFDCL